MGIDQLTSSEAAILDDYRFMMGHDAGNLALALDQLTDAMTIISQHKVYCRVEKGPRAGEASLDVVELIELMNKTKGLIQESLLRLKEKPSL